MNSFPLDGGRPEQSGLSDDQVLQMLDLATEVLEGLDELGVSSRAELLALMERLERLVADDA